MDKATSQVRKKGEGGNHVNGRKYGICLEVEMEMEMRME